MEVKFEDERSNSDPRPDINELFYHYNSLYFNDAIVPCVVNWAHSHIARCPGMCDCTEEGICEIRLSEPLLKFRSNADVKNTLLHEMIHAYLYFSSNLTDHSYHGPGFRAVMNAINKSSKKDPQRPSGGYNITLSHDLSNDVDGDAGRSWMGASCGCGDVIKRPMKGEPSATDSDIYDTGHKKACGNLSCHWHRDKMLSSGMYRAETEITGHKGKRRITNDGQDNEEDKTKGLSYERTPAHTLTDTHPSRKGGMGKQQKAISLVETANALSAKVPRRPRTPVLLEKQKFDISQEVEYDECERKSTLECLLLLSMQMESQRKT